MLCALIMAGGKGERFWPLSTDEKPKQFLNLLGKGTMIQMTVNRLLPLIPMERIFVVTSKNYEELVKEQLPYLNERNIIVEPVAKNTAPCIALSAFIINKYYKDAAIVVLPADHIVQKQKKFIDTINKAYKFVEENEETVVTLGMKPNRVETGYGYIQINKDNYKSKIKNESLEAKSDKKSLRDKVQLNLRGSYGCWEMINGEWRMESKKDSQNLYSDDNVKSSNRDEELKAETEDNYRICKVEKFIEKPDLKKAEEYIYQGNFLWNGGIFIWKCSTILKLTKQYLNVTYNVLSGLSNVNHENFYKNLEKRYHAVENISVDYGIMEKIKNIYVIPSDIGWDDVGTWHAVERYIEKDSNNNVCMGNIKNIEGRNNIVVAKEKPIVVSGLKDVFIVESDEIIFVGKKEDIKRIKDIKQKVV